MNKIVFICPYFGKLPENQLKLFLKGCMYNPNIDWIMLLDDTTQYKLPKNVHVVYMNINEIENRLTKKFHFKISIKSPYKLCDLKPMYGFIFEEEIKQYSYWGYCDITDSIFGNIEKYIDYEVIKDFEKIGILGHLTLYKNNYRNNRSFMLKSKSNITYKKILETEINMGFDETSDYSINMIYVKNNIPIKRIDNIYADISPLFKDFRLTSCTENFVWNKVNNKKYIFEWNEGKLYKICMKDNNILKDEIGYVHYQKRKLKYLFDIDNCNHFYLIPNKFIKGKLIDNNEIIKILNKRYNVDLTFAKIKFKRLKIHINNLIIILKEKIKK